MQILLHIFITVDEHTTFQTSVLHLPSIFTTLSVTFPTNTNQSTAKKKKTQRPRITKHKSNHRTNKDQNKTSPRRQHTQKQIYSQTSDSLSQLTVFEIWVCPNGPKQNSDIRNAGKLNVGWTLIGQNLITFLMKKRGHM